MITVREAAEAKLPSDMARSFDCALPQEWINRMQTRLGTSPCGHFVWLYDDAAPIFGRPFPVTAAGEFLLKRFEKEVTK